MLPRPSQSFGDPLLRFSNGMGVVSWAHVQNQKPCAGLLERQVRVTDQRF